MSIKRKIQLKLLNLSQRLLNKAYEKGSLTDKVLDLQLEINQLRNEFDLNESDDEYVQ